VSLLPFLVLGVGGAWVGLLVCAQDNRVRESAVARVLARIVVFAKAAARVMREWTVSVAEATEAIRRTMDALNPSLPAQEDRSDDARR